MRSWCKWYVVSGKGAHDRALQRERTRTVKHGGKRKEENKKGLSTGVPQDGCTSLSTVCIENGAASSVPHGAFDTCQTRLVNEILFWDPTDVS